MRKQFENESIFEIWYEEYDTAYLLYVSVEWTATEYESTEDYAGYYEIDFKVVSVIDEDDNVHDWSECPISDDDILDAIQKEMEGGI